VLTYSLYTRAKAVDLWSHVSTTSTTCSRVCYSMIGTGPITVEIRRIRHATYVTVTFKLVLGKLLAKLGNASSDLESGSHLK